MPGKLHLPQNTRVFSRIAFQVHSMTPDVNVICLFSVLDRSLPWKSQHNELTTQLIVHWERRQGPAVGNLKENQVIVGPCL